MARSPTWPPGSVSSRTPAALTPASMPTRASRPAPRHARPANTHPRQALGEMNTDLLLGTGAVTRTGVRVGGDGVDAIWALSWPEQQAAGISPVVLRAYYGVGAHHPHLQGGTVGDWPLNVFDEREAAAELPTLRE